MLTEDGADFAVTRDQVDSRHDLPEHDLGNDQVEVDPDPARSDSLAALCDLTAELVALFEVDAQQSMTVRAGAGASTA